MSGSAEGYAKARVKLYERYGGPEGLKRHLAEIGGRGGSQTPKSGKRGFALLDHDKLVEIAGKGGRNSRGKRAS